jgi:small subunit ribosomal protein S8
MTDPIADMLTRLRNAINARHARVDVPTSRLKAEIARILEREGYIQGFKVVEDAPEADGPVIHFRADAPGRTVIAHQPRQPPGSPVYFGP